MAASCLGKLLINEKLISIVQKSDAVKCQEANKQEYQRKTGKLTRTCSKHLNKHIASDGKSQREVANSVVSVSR
jgi:hypothetical protein